MSDVHKAIEKAMPFMQHVLTCESYQNNADLSEPGSRRDHPCTCGYEEAYRGLQTVLLLSRDAGDARTVSQRAAGRAFELRGLLHRPEALATLSEALAKFGEETLALSRDGKREGWQPIETLEGWRPLPDPPTKDIIPESNAGVREAIVDIISDVVKNCDGTHKPWIVIDQAADQILSLLPASIDVVGKAREDRA